MNVERRTGESRNNALVALLTKAGLGEADRAFLFGAFLEIAAIETGTPTYLRLRVRGAEALGADITGLDGMRGIPND